MRRLLPSALVVAVLALGALTTSTAPSTASTASTASPVHWLCSPALAHDPCRGSLVTTVEHADGTTTVRRPRAAKHAKVDCFYVYPTSSQQLTPNSDGHDEASVDAVTRLQAMRFSSLCRVYAPLYRQRTLVALTAEKTQTYAQKAHYYRVAYADVLHAWRTYWRRDNHGRGVVLIGHSQGSRLLRKLIREQIDPRPAVRRHLVSAVLPGANVLVRRGRDIGGDFTHLHLCDAAHRVRCVMAWSTFGTTPPSDSRFGRSPTSRADSAGLGLPYGPRYRVACTDPASLGADRPRVARTLIRSEMVPGLLGALLLETYGGLPPSAATPWLVPTDHYRVQCRTLAGAHVLLATGVDGARTLHPAPDATWGLHLTDLNLSLGDILTDVGRQIRAYTSR